MLFGQQSPYNGGDASDHTAEAAQAQEPGTTVHEPAYVGKVTELITGRH
jgi:hypothetical protein